MDNALLQEFSMASEAEQYPYGVRIGLLLQKPDAARKFESYLLEWRDWGESWLRDNEESLRYQRNVGPMYDRYEAARQAVNRLRDRVVELKHRLRQLPRGNPGRSTGAKELKRIYREWRDVRSAYRTIYHQWCKCVEEADKAPRDGLNHPCARFTLLPAATEATEPKLLCLQYLLLALVYDVTMQGERTFRCLTQDILDERDIPFLWETVAGDWPKWRPTVDDALQAAAADLTRAGGSREKPWDESRKGFVSLTLAHQRYCTSGTAPRLPWLSRQCRPDGPFDYMRKRGKGVRVDELQFKDWATEKGYTKEAVQKAEALVVAHKKSPAGVRDRLHKEHDMDWPEEYRNEGRR